jgi:peroxiredoxin Q/BCP
MRLANSDKRKAKKMLEVGDLAPDFDLAADGGARLRLAAFRARPVVLYFYPKDDTEGCTLEATEFNALSPDFERSGVTVIGISPDSPKSHAKFKRKHDLTLHLAADEDKAVAGAYGVWIEKSMYGRTFMGVERATFLISAKGRILRIWHKVKSKGHAAEVLAALADTISSDN